MSGLLTRTIATIDLISDTFSEVLKIGTFGWLTFAIAGAEVLLWIKLSRDQFPHLIEHPPIIVLAWTAILILTLVFTVFYFYIGKCHIKPTNQQNAKKNK